MTYILTPANRWANKQIDDFTLIMEMGEFESFCVSKSFFDDPNDWIINGIGNNGDLKKSHLVNVYENEYDNNAVMFNIRNGNVIFSKKNFKPRGELYLHSFRYYNVNDVFDFEKDVLPYSIYDMDLIDSCLDENSKLILKNLPYARRGYIFKNKKIQNYYEKFTDWYIPNPSYQADTLSLTEEERLWLSNLK